MRRWKSSLVIIAFVSTFVLTWWGEASAFFSFQINEFRVSQGQAVNFVDTFNAVGGTPPPSGPNGANTYTATGTFAAGDESGGNLVLNSIGAAQSFSPSLGTFLSVKGATLQNQIFSGASFFVEADFAGILPGIFANTREQYRIRLQDLGSDNNDSPGVRVITTLAGTPRIDFFRQDISGGTFNVLGSVFPGPLSPELTLRLDVDSLANVTALFDPDGPSGGLPFSSIPGTTSIYNGEDFTFAQFQAVGPPVPEPGTLLLLGSGLVGMGAVARRRNRRK